VIVLLVSAAPLALAGAATAAKPAVDFAVTPSAPAEGMPASYVAVLSSGDRRLAVEWDFDGDLGGIFETQGASVSHVYTTPGEKQVSMRVVKEGEVKQVVTKTIYVSPRPFSVPAPPADPTSGPPLPTAPQPEPPDPAVIDGAPSLMTPFPVVRIAGQLLPWGARVRLLAVTTPPKAVVTARCHGVGCPLRSLRRRARAPQVRLRAFERRLVAGVRLEILVRQHGFVGKYTRFRIRDGVRPPLRDDRCLLPGRRVPVGCSFG
jgi:PKD domain